MREVDKLARPGSNRSEFIEAAVRRFIEQLRRERINSKDIEIINRHAKRLNREAADVLEYQVLP
ncbi:MAG: hypothetical protein GF401_02385 [Chitinivibrionales bacterium]|nr:hypothetical protein [Chitinivibrionales bacterium]